MKKIERPYAIIYVDETGECMNDSADNYTPMSVIDDYYGAEGFLQWNHYLIIPSKFVDKKEKTKVESNEFYTRKFVIDENKIESFIEKTFPDTIENNSKLVIVTGNNWKKTCEKAQATYDALAKKYKDHYLEFYPSWNRELNSIDSLIAMTKLRADLISSKKHRIAIFYSHIEHEIYLANKKFKTILLKQSK